MYPGKTLSSTTAERSPSFISISTSGRVTWGTGRGCVETPSGRHSGRRQTSGRPSQMTLSFGRQLIGVCPFPHLCNDAIEVRVRWPVHLKVLLADLVDGLG